MSDKDKSSPQLMMVWTAGTQTRIMARACFFLVLVLSTLEVVPAQEDQCPSSSNGGFSSTLDSCRTSGDCRHVSCSSISVTGGTLNLTLAVDNCKDPVLVTLMIAGAVGECSGRFYVNGDGNVGRTLSLAGGLQLNATLGRSTTHLQLQLREISPVAARRLLVNMSVPLNPSTCMCNSMRGVASSLTLPALLSSTITRTCSADSTSCAAFLCDFVVSSDTYHSRILINPCTEVVNLNVVDGERNTVLNRDFTNSVSLPINTGSFVNPVAYIVIKHFKYSMVVTVLVEFLGGNSTIIPRQRIILDRSSCSQTTFPNVHASPPTSHCAIPTGLPPTAPTSIGTHTLATTTTGTGAQTPRTLPTTGTGSHTRGTLPTTGTGSHTRGTPPTTGTGSHTHGTPPTTGNETHSHAMPPTGTTQTHPPGTHPNGTLPPDVTGTHPHPSVAKHNATTTVAPAATERRTSLSVAIGVPIFIVLAAALIVGGVVIGILAYMRMKKQRAIQFRRMTFSAMEDDDDEFD